MVFGAVRKCANLIELDKCFQTHHNLQKSASLQPRTSSPKICKINKILILLISGAAEVMRLGSGPEASTDGAPEVDETTVYTGIIKSVNRDKGSGQ